MFNNFTSLVQKAQTLIDTAGLTASPSKSPSKSTLFQHQFRLPDSESPLYEITSELTLPLPRSGRQPQDANDVSSQLRGNHYVGRLHLSEHYICFSTQGSSFLSTATTSSSSSFTGQTHGTGPSGNGFTLPLCAVRRVERLNSQSFQFSLAITTSNGYRDVDKKQSTNPNPQRLIVQLAGSRQQCERFCDGLKKGLRAAYKDTQNLNKVVGELYSEYHLADTATSDKEGSTTTQRDPPDTGLGAIYRYPGDARKLRDKAKMRLWKEYMRENGRNATIVRQPTFHKLIRVGLPNRLRGEIWELTSGSLFLRFQNPDLYAEMLKEHEGKQSLAIDEIEKDLNRSLPEYPGFQSEEGIGRLRRVLVAYSWLNPEVGYCQAMNIVVAALLIYMSEAQAFFVLSVLCDRMLPGYYSMTMYGTLLDQKVFESLVEGTMPILWDHLVKSDVQLSVVSLPWFLSLYINSMPLIFAYRVLDVFFLEGPKVLFQIGLAILRINGEELLDAADDGTFISVLKTYFSRLDESAHPKSENPKLRAVTRFQELMVVAFKEFSGITQGTISEQRAKHKDAVLENIENFAKRTSIRNLGPDSKRLSLNDLGFLYDRFYGVLYERQQRTQMIQQEMDRKKKSGRIKATEVVSGVSGDEPEMGRVALGPSPTQMDYAAFREFLAGIAKWAVTDSPSSPSSHVDGEKASYFGNSMRSRSLTISPWGAGPEPADHDFMKRLFRKWDVDSVDTLTLQNVVTGLAHMKGTKDIMANISYFFDLYDDDGDGKIDREGILSMSEALLFLSRRGFETPFPAASPQSDARMGSSIEADELRIENRDEQFLSSVSAFIRRCFEYADADHPSKQIDDSTSALSNFGIGEDEEEEEDEDEALIEIDGTSTSTPKPEHASSPPNGASTSETPSDSASSLPRRDPAAANAALDPSNPLSITLPTFRMLVLADETLEHFFDRALANSFRLSDAPAATASSTLTTFANLGRFTPGVGAGPSSPLPSTAGVVPPGKGLRGVLDNIVTDGMRVATDIRRRMDEAQKELDRGAAQEEDEEDEAEPDERTPGGAYGGDADQRSVRAADRDLLEGAETEDVSSTMGKEGLLNAPGGDGKGRTRAGSEEVGEVLF
ncbi:GTPase-activating protein GYP5 [Eremomyces bilateralis CBS 781.70]|uniref:GTPase-activating protein GYP5 n=1 Tax=Eremomyces bilateralis CBS 781.70 TaxID=1392243 RepID=A0A6G1GEN2_9PEZI|nr:GTPase-activating protein GYP5 [Eremomyces bilateralis CBS 781.70]KAF1816361.1 GTPase-activating protein GYP5 [Eremomyces bilateralis CBS 781.70]